MSAPADPMPQNCCQKATAALQQFLYESPLEVTIALIAGAVLAIFSHLLALPLLIYALAVTLTRLIVFFAKSPLKKVSLFFFRAREQLPYLDLIALLIALITALFFPIIGTLLVLPSALFLGLIAHYLYIKVQQQISPGSPFGDQLPDV